MLLEIVLNEEIGLVVKQDVSIDGLLINNESIERKYASETGLGRKRRFKRRLRENAIVKPRSIQPIKAEETRACADIWHSVIIQALYDISGKGGNLERRLVRAEALAWFAASGSSKGESDFEYICQLIDMQPQKIREIGKLVRDNGKEIMEGFNFRTIRKNSSERQGRKTTKKHRV